MIVADLGWLWVADGEVTTSSGYPIQ